jgi:glycosyltransferase involved in cell wall biosynthesis
MLDLDEDGVIVFFGTMNAMPMMYAKELIKAGQRVVYFVDVGPDDILSRPENHFPTIEYPYPEWIVECVIPSPLLISFFPGLIMRWMLTRAGLDPTGRGIKAVFASGNFVSLLPRFNRHVQRFFLSFGSDLDVWCNRSNIAVLQETVKRRWRLLSYLPRAVSMYLVAHVIEKSRASAGIANAVIYFPRGMSPPGDEVIDELVQEGVKYVTRYDVSFEPLLSARREFKRAGTPLVVFSGVRFLFESMTEANQNEYKGNDLIIRGLGLYCTRNSDIEIHFVEKGPDVEAAKRLCSRVGIADKVVWHPEMPFRDLLKLYEAADICFDQVGKHWVGAIGVYAMYLGKPLIANSRNLTFLEDAPIFDAATPEEIVAQMVRLENEDLRRHTWSSAKDYAETHFGPMRVLDELTGGAMSARGHRECAEVKGAFRTITDHGNL